MSLFKFRHTYFIAIIVLLAYGCSKENQETNSSVNIITNPLIGEWNWIKSVEAMTQQVTTPLSEGYTLIAKFKTNDTVEFFKNYSLIYSLPYKLEYRIENIIDPNSDSSLVLVIDNGTETYFTTNNDTLILMQSYVDGPNKYYSRRH